MMISTEPLHLDAKESAIMEALKVVKVHGYKPKDEEILNLYTVRNGGYTGAWFWNI